MYTPKYKPRSPGGKLLKQLERPKDGIYLITGHGSDNPGVEKKIPKGCKYCTFAECGLTTSSEDPRVIRIENEFMKVLTSLLSHTPTTRVNSKKAMIRTIPSQKNKLIEFLRIFEDASKSTVQYFISESNLVQMEFSTFSSKNETSGGWDGYTGVSAKSLVEDVMIVSKA